MALLCLALPRPVRANPAEICDSMAHFAAAESGIPVEVLMAITRTETGRNRGGGLQPWPWTVNMEGAGHWFGTQDEARAYVFKEFKRGARSFDVGCFQINYKWHGDAFTSIDEMFDPEANALYAGRLLADLYRETGSWSKAAGAYHSRTPSYAERYSARFDRIYAALGPGAPQVAPVGAENREAAGPDTGIGTGDASGIPDIPDIVLAMNDPSRPGAEPRRPNSYPLLQGGAGAGYGSLVPISAGGGASLFAAASSQVPDPHSGEAP